LPAGDGGAAGPPFVAVGYGTIRASSDDGKTWVRAPDPTMLPTGWVGPPISGDNQWLLRGGCFGRGLFVAVGGTGGDKGLLLTSNDGSTWRVIGEQANDDCAYGNGLFVTSSRYSTDGVTWIRAMRAAPTRNMVFGADLFVTAGDQNGGNVSYTRDGRAWTNLAITFVGTGTMRKGYSRIAYGNGRFVAVHTFFQDSPIFEWDGKTDTSFTERSRTAELGEPATVQAIAYGRGAFVLLSSGFLFRRPDGATAWQKIKTAGARPGGNLVVTDQLYVTDRAWSIDGVTWVAATNPPTSITKLFAAGR
jgi:hypothetical protein